MFCFFERASVVAAKNKIVRYKAKIQTEYWTENTVRQFICNLQINIYSIFSLPFYFTRQPYKGNIRF